MGEFIDGELGLLHFTSAVLAMLSGAIVLASTKGTNLHKKVGYVYFVSMLVLNITAIPITNMSGSIGVFHIFILFSLPTTLIALYHPLFGRHKPSWLLQHFTFMYWSYVGLIAAFIAEMMVRLPALIFTKSKGIKDADSELGLAGIVAFSILGGVMFFAELGYRKWRKQFTHPNK